MESILSLLDSQIQYLSHEFMADQVVFRAKTCFVTAICPYCGIEANTIHSKYRRVFQDIPISTFETVIHLEQEMLVFSLETSSINAAKRLNQQNIKISKSTIYRLIKKKKL
ncbi:transposase family protein [Bacillus cereus]|uniref:transposase family protein n=1 Tax=Bacillus cereus TaxID=1396 RepID=UPI0009515EC2|nr:transposase family protein [Bacillus cereus]OLR27692.1 hypothetical protein BLD50_00245 [Bacillus cereus]